MKKTSTSHIKKSAVTKQGLPSTTLRKENNQETLKKISSQQTSKEFTGNDDKTLKTTVVRAGKLNSNNVTNPKAQTNPNTNLNRSGKLTKKPNSNQDARKSLVGNFNVTVFSPPSARKVASKLTKEQTTASTRDRTRTRTLRLEEVTALENIPQIIDDAGKAKAKPPPIAFDIKFESNKQTSTSSTKKQISNTVPEVENHEDQYDSEFESYESDFETGSSNKSSSSSISSNKSSSSDLSSKSTNTEESSDSAKEHTGTRLNNDQNLDSGNYNMKLKQLSNSKYNHITLGRSSKQDDYEPDSGINSGVFDTQLASNCSKVLQKRYADILNKISFNTMEFDLYEDTPAPYEYFVKSYGMVKGVQSQTQTEIDASSCETQTDNIYRKSCWVQYPPKLSMTSINNMNNEPHRYSEENLGTGQENFHEESNTSHHDDIFSDFLKNLESRKINNPRSVYKANCNCYNLCNFLGKSVKMVENVLIRSVESSDTPKSKTVQLKLHEISDNSTVTAACFDVDSHNVFLTLHECNAEKSHHRYLVSVWDTRNFVKPKAILSCWSTVTCTERIGVIVIAGTADGTLCLWNITENSEEVSPLQLISPTANKRNGNCHYGSIVAVRTANSRNSLGHIISPQVLTLFESGVLVTWSISKSIQLTGSNELNLNVIFHNARLRLTQQHVLMLFSIQKRLMPQHFSVSNNFQKGSLDDLLISKNNGINEHTRYDLRICNDMIICNKKAIIQLSRQIMIVNYLEQKCCLILNHQDPMTNFKEHPEARGYMFMLASDNTIKIKRMSRHTNITTTHNKSKVQSAKQFSSHSNLKLSPVLTNKSCTIQNIVKNERKLYHGDSHANDLAFPLSSNIDNNSPNSCHRQKESEPLHFFHNQSFFLKQADQINSRLHFLSQGQVLCVGADNNAKFINLNTGQENYISDYIQTDSKNSRLLGTTDKQVIMTTDGREIYFYDI